jgi:hypothetical protein
MENEERPAHLRHCGCRSRRGEAIERAMPLLALSVREAGARRRRSVAVGPSSQRTAPVFGEPNSGLRARRRNANSDETSSSCTAIRNHLFCGGRRRVDPLSRAAGYPCFARSKETAAAPLSYRSCSFEHQCPTLGEDTAVVRIWRAGLRRRSTRIGCREAAPCGVTWRMKRSRTAFSRDSVSRCCVWVTPSKRSSK